MLLAFSVLVTGCQRKIAPKPAAKKAESKKTVAVGVVRAQLLEKTIELPASIESDETAMLMARVEAYVGEVHVNIGDEVEAGQVLVLLEAPELGQKADAQAAMIEQLKAGEQVLLAELTAARTQLEVAGAQVRLKQSERDRRARLVSTGAISEQLLVESEAALQSSSAMLAKYQNAIEIVKAKLSQGESEMAVGMAKLEQAKTLTDYLQIKAPFAGVVAERNVDPGNLVRPSNQGSSMKPLLVVAKIDKLRAVVHATTDVASKLAVGQVVQFVADDVPGKIFVGRLSRMAGTYNQRTRMMQAEIDLDNTPDLVTGERPLRSGSYGAVTIVLESATLPVVPESALRKRGDRTSVVIVRDGVCLMTPVKIAFQSGDRVAIAEGLVSGDRVVAAPEGIKDEQTLEEKQIDVQNW